jgi:D-alanyl-D-alanine carboxypeptidase/D-alanyl-D-alanine-endopeptidase (penicillin-binding protein 4)
MSDMDRLIGGLPASASLVVDGAALYGHGADVPRQPASNEKLLLTMTALDELGPGFRIPTVAAAKAATGGVVPGDLWLIGHGDPGLDAVGLRRLARRIRTFGIQRVTGSVVGDTSEFRRDRGAPGWHPIALRFIGLPTALSYEHNVDAGGFVFDPEERAAAALTADLRGLGIRVGGAPRAAGAPAHILTLARVRSAPLADILTLQNAVSDNLDAETLSKLLGARERGRGSIAGGARVIQGWANDRGAGVRIFDASGLSYRDRVTTSGLAELLDGAQAERWGTTFRDTLPAPGEGTLAGRLGGLPVRAKTGTLIQHVSALSGYVRLADGRWGSFSILSRLPKDRAVALEDAIVRVFAASG